MVNSLTKIRDLFPALKQNFNGLPLVYFDNAATTLKPQVVIDEITNHYSFESGNIHRGVHRLSEVATQKYELSREIVRNFINARKSQEIIFTKGTTESINLIASSFAFPSLKEGDEILISHMEHHSNIVPWQVLRDSKKIILKVAPINDQGEIELEKFEQLLSDKTKIVSVTAISNSLGTINPIKKMISLIRKNSSAKIVVDAAQAIAHEKIDVQDWDVDFLAFSGHKIYGPTGIGILYGKESLLEAMRPYQLGGDMIASVRFDQTLFNELPHKFEAGTPPIASGIALGTALNFFSSLSLEEIINHEEELRLYGEKELSSIEAIKLIGTASKKASIISFIMKGIHPHDIGTFLSDQEIAIRTGHHCTQPVMEYFKIPATARASFAIYNTKEEIDHLKATLLKAVEFFL